jgi:hypothetical protein
LQFVESASLETEVNTKEQNNNQLALLVAGLTIPVLASAKLFSFLMANHWPRHSQFSFGISSFAGFHRDLE